MFETAMFVTLDIVGDAERIDGSLREERARRIAALRSGGEAREGLSALLAKRPPSWSD